MAYQNLMGRFIISDGSGVLHAEYFYDSLSMMLWVSVIFLFISTIRLNDKVCITISKISTLTMGIYILHPLVIRVYSHFIPVDTLPLSLIYFIVVLLATAVIVAIMKKIPFLKRLIEY